MINAIKAEFRKVFTVRSTYLWLAALLVLLVFFSFYVGGIHTDKVDLLDHQRLFRLDQQSISFLAIFPALIGILLFTHEFRFNTISYSLTLSNKRIKVLLAKILVVSVIAIVSTTFVGVVAPLLAKWGMSAHHLKLVSQHFSYGALIWRGLVYGWGYAMAGLVIAAFIRNQIGAVITFFIVPGTVEGLLSIWLKNNTVYLPFSALHQMLGVDLTTSSASLSSFHAMLVFLAYIVVAWAIAGYMFITRDAS